LEIAKINLHILALEEGISRNNQKIQLFNNLKEVATVTKDIELMTFYTTQNRRLENESIILRQYLD